MRNFLMSLHTVLCMAEAYHNQQGKGSPDMLDFAQRERAIATCKRYLEALDKFSTKVRPT